MDLHALGGVELPDLDWADTVVVPAWPASQAFAAAVVATVPGVLGRYPVLRSPAAMPLTVSSSPRRRRGSGSGDSRTRASSATCR